MKQEWINQYLEERSRAWSTTTLKTETYRLNAVKKLINGSPAKLWDHLQRQASYTRVITWTRVTAFWDWCRTKGYIQGPNPYADFRENNRHFRHAYRRRPARMSFAEAKARVDQIPDPAVRARALLLLHTGMRYSELAQFDPETGEVNGKTGPREILSQPKEKGPEFDRHYVTFLRHLRKVGLKPHDLRKIYATHLNRKGIDVFDLCKIMGWTTLTTPQSYVAANQTERLRTKVQEAVDDQD